MCVINDVQKISKVIQTQKKNWYRHDKKQKTTNRLLTVYKITHLKLMNEWQAPLKKPGLHDLRSSRFISRKISTILTLWYKNWFDKKYIYKSLGAVLMRLVLQNDMQTFNSKHWLQSRKTNRFFFSILIL